MAFDEDLTVFFDEDEFAVLATFAPQDGAPTFMVKGIYDSAYLLAATKDAQLSTDKPRFTCVFADVATVQRGDTCMVKGRTLDVLDIEHDGTGVAMVVLSP